MEIRVETADSLNTLLAKLGQERFDFVTVHGNCEAVPEEAPVLSNAPALHGATSCLGAMTQAGVTKGVAGFAIKDPAGAYGTGLKTFDTDPKAAAGAATRAALLAADRLGEIPDLIWVSATPGTEEEVLAGIQDTVGRDVPIIGGSAADNSVEGNWLVFDGTEAAPNGVVVSVLFPSSNISFAYQSGYSPSSTTGVVTRADGRTIHEIDGRPALEVYAEWTGNTVAATAEDGGMSILSDSTLFPLGREVAELDDVPFYLLAHPAVAHETGAIDLFATVAEGETLTRMTGTKDSLTSRAGRVANLARMAGRMGDKPISGALMIYCGGCMLSVKDRLTDVVDGVNTALDSAPFLGAFTFGEQGALLGAGNRHGNLMISCIVFE